MQFAIARKIRMLSMFSEKGRQIPVTELELLKAKITEVKKLKKDGYSAIQITTEDKKKKKRIKEFRILTDTPVDMYEKGQDLKIDEIIKDKQVSVTGFSKGKGFQGAIKRHNFSRGPMSHGSHHKRKTGAIGQCEMPARVFKGKKMPGHMGHTKITIKNLKVIKQDDTKIYLKGGVPGPNGNYLAIRS